MKTLSSTFISSLREREREGEREREREFKITLTHISFHRASSQREQTSHGVEGD